MPRRAKQRRSSLALTSKCSVCGVIRKSNGIGRCMSSTMPWLAWAAIKIEKTIIHPAGKCSGKDGRNYYPWSSDTTSQKQSTKNVAKPKLSSRCQLLLGCNRSRPGNLVRFGEPHGDGDYYGEIRLAVRKTFARRTRSNSCSESP